MEFELPKINVSFEYDEEKDEIVFVINGVEKRVKTADMITEMEELQEQNTTLEQQPCGDCISRQVAIDALTGWETEPLDEDIERILKQMPSVTPKLQMVQNPCVECGCNYCTNDDCVNRYIVDIAESEE